MSASFTFEGLEEFAVDLTKLPVRLRDRARDIVENAAEEARASIVQAYPRRTGNLRRGVQIEHKPLGAFGQLSIVRNKAAHAFIYENGTVARHTSLGANRGAMPAGKVFVPIARRRRRWMYQELKAMMASEALQVTGDA
jgi:hypothetical protein